MPNLFSSDKKGKENKMKPRMRRSLPGVETISTTNTLIVHAVGGGCAVLIFSSIGSCYELSSGERRKRGLISNILHKQVPARCRDQVPVAEKIGICSSSSCSKAETILSSIPYLSNNKPTAVADTAQAGRFWSAI